MCRVGTFDIIIVKNEILRMTTNLSMSNFYLFPRFTLHIFVYESQSYE